MCMLGSLAHHQALPMLGSPWISPQPCPEPSLGSTPCMASGPPICLSLWAVGVCGVSPCPASCAVTPYSYSQPSLLLTAKREFSALPLGTRRGAANLCQTHTLMFPMFPHCSRFECIKLERNARNEPKLKLNTKIYQKIEYG